jgi:hypothetical protein
MKKMMMVLAVALLAIGAQAGAVQWTVSGIRTPTGTVSDINDGTLLGGAIAYVYGGVIPQTPQTITDVRTALNNTSFSTAGSLKSGTSATTGAISGTTFGSYTSTTVGLYVIVFDSAIKTEAGQTGWFMISSLVTKTFSATGNQSYVFAFNSTASTWYGYTVVPEPTSMALLALGVAAVGLRRKFRK